MLLCCVFGLLVIATIGAGAFAAPSRARSSLYAPLASFLEDREREMESAIDETRRSRLVEIADFVRSCNGAGRPASLMFVCTHNSRRSHIAQLLAAAGAFYYEVDVRTYSGGTERTAFNPCAVDAIGRAGFAVEKTTNDANPIYHVRMGDSIAPMTCFSKVYDSAPNPSVDFGAIMVCNDADERCPSISGASARVGLTYVDPKVAEGTPREQTTYDERCRQIGREMLFMMRAASAG